MPFRRSGCGCRGCCTTRPARQCELAGAPSQPRNCASNCSVSTAFDAQSEAPAARQRARSSSIAFAVRVITGSRVKRGSSRSRSRAALSACGAISARRRRGARAPGAVEKGLHLGFQHFRRHRHEHVIAGAELQAARAVEIGRTVRSQEHDRGVAVAQHRAQGEQGARIVVDQQDRGDALLYGGRGRAGFGVVRHITGDRAGRRMATPPEGRSGAGRGGAMPEYIGVVWGCRCAPDCSPPDAGMRAGAGLVETTIQP